MNVLISILVLTSSLFALSSLPFAKLNTKLLDAKEKLRKLSYKQEQLPIQKHYIDEYNKLTGYAETIVKDFNIDKDELSTYLNKIRKVDRIYTEVLFSTRVDVSTTIIEDNYIKFLDIVDTNLPSFFEKHSFRKGAIDYYKINKKEKSSSIMEREIKYDKAKITLIEMEEKQANKAMKSQEIVSQTLNERRLQSDENIDLRYIKTAYLDPKLYAKRENAFTPWMSKQEYQGKFDNGYYKEKNSYPAYIEMNKNGDRRVIEIPYEPRFYWSCTSGRLYKRFKKNHVGYTVNGKKLLSLHIQVVDGVKVYTGIWVTKEYYNRELLKLSSYGIYPK